MLLRRAVCSLCCTFALFFASDWQEPFSSEFPHFPHVLSICPVGVMMRLIKLVFVPRLTEFVLQETSALSLESVDCENPMVTYLQILPVQLCIFVFLQKITPSKTVCLTCLVCADTAVAFFRFLLLCFVGPLGAVCSERF